MSEDMNISDILTEQIDRLFSNEITAKVWAAAEDGNFATALWQEITAMGVTSALVCESAGGAGLSWVDVEPVLRLCGRHAAPVPLGETMLAAWNLANAGLEIPEVPLAISPSVWQLDVKGRVSGIDPLIAWAPQLEYVVGVARSAGKQHICLLRIADIQAIALQTYERIPAAKLNIEHVVPVQIGDAPHIGKLGLKPHLATLRSVQMAGALDRILALCVEYGNTRVQFGKPIGKFQAIQHMIAELAGHTAAAQVAGLYACRQIATGIPADAEFGAAIAKTRLGSAATRATAIAHQVFGAIGVTDEHQLHYFTRRLWQWRAEAGSEHEWAQYLGRQAFDAGSAMLWDRLARHAAA
ncbi:acyl-CoA dehydrogenase family protein [Noviherbaspirillum saxi]|uniref:Acyl-CoA dehydrogenase n=1 Tax=Noviherbaspirillum saxi TaxID=2320863 RepID=A0A3A3FFA5_9BURK|nr:acyl-CoA dehydrogenase family protein [Noviherbaspirillum saxi]RJF91727.1 acyl-CoA dehydrogenase [Noviherbaspirillum saxi]